MAVASEGMGPVMSMPRASAMEWASTSSTATGAAGMVAESAVAVKRAERKSCGNILMSDEREVAGLIVGCWVGRQVE